MKSLVGKGSIVLDSQDQVRFEVLVLSHLDAAFNLARWLLRSGADAEDDAQEAIAPCVSFLQWFSRRRYARLAVADRAEQLFHLTGENRRVKDTTEFDDELHGLPGPTPESLAIAADSRGRLAHALEPCRHAIGR